MREAIDVQMFLRSSFTELKENNFQSGIQSLHSIQQWRVAVVRRAARLYRSARQCTITSLVYNNQIILFSEESANRPTKEFSYLVSRRPISSVQCYHLTSVRSKRLGVMVHPWSET